MTKPSGKQFPGTNRLPVGISFTFLQLFASSNPRSPQGHPLVLHSVPLPRCRHPPRFLPLPLVGGRGRNFEGSLPPSQLQVGVVLSRHWSAWELCDANVWTVAVLQDGCCIPFHHLLPVSLLPWELLYCSLGLVQALVLGEEVIKMLKWSLWPSRVPVATVSCSW